MAVPMLLYVYKSELHKNEERIIEAAEIRFLWTVASYTLLNKIRNN